ncbi:MAG: DUF481 domain-containing protein [Alphaproteobacteria bacterium]|nr:DUF481 domain-containing protein [Alphaproteobacteria bacterium]
MRSGRLTFWVLIFCLLVSPSAFSDTLTLRNGDRLTGQIVGLKDGTLRFKTTYAGVLRVPGKEIAGLASEKPVTVRFATGGYKSGILYSSSVGMIRIRGLQGGFTDPIDVATVSEIYPGTEIQRGFKWSGRVNLGASKRSGNTETRSFHLDAAIKAESETDRLRLEGSFNKEFSGGERTEDDFTAFVQHDHFLSKALYFYTNAKFARNKPQDLTLRTTLGTGAGWQILKGARTNLSLEAGPSYVNENYDAAADNDVLAGRWAVNFDHYIWKKRAQFFHAQEGTLDLEDTGNVFIDSSTGIRFPLSDGFNLTLQADIDWDSDPAPGTSGTDKKYLMTVGYSW